MMDYIEPDSAEYTKVSVAFGEWRVAVSFRYQLRNGLIEYFSAFKIPVVFRIIVHCDGDTAILQNIDQGTGAIALCKMDVKIRW